MKPRNVTSFVVCFVCTHATAQVTSRASVSTGGAAGNGDSGYTGLSISADGRYVAFQSLATDLVAGDTNGCSDVFVRDRQLGTTERVSVSTAGVQGNSHSRYPSISADGRFVAFLSDATNLVTGDNNALSDIFVRDRQLGTTELVSVGISGSPGNQASWDPWISSDGRYVAFASFATDLVPADTNGGVDVFVRDRQSGTTERVSLDSAGVQGNGQSGVSGVSISADGRQVAFQSSSTNLVAGDTNASDDIFVHDRQLGTTELVSVSTAGVQGNGHSRHPSISADGRYVAFWSIATNLVAGDTNLYPDIFVRDRQLGTTERVSVDSGGVQGNANSGDGGLSISADGRCVAFQSLANNLVAGDSNGRDDVFVHDRQTGSTERVSVSSAGAQGEADSRLPSVSADARYVAFWSLATDLVPSDTDGVMDVFVRDRSYSPLESLCDPGVGGVISCPCSNPPNGSGRGCDNSSGTGGALLSASGIAYLSMDSLVLATVGERPTATSILLQGTNSPPAGVVYGQGVRCVGGTLERLFVKNAVGGSIAAPDFGAGDPTVSARSAFLGDAIQPGQSRWYLVYYRDPIVLGGCPATSTFNATQTGGVSWWP